MKEASKNTIENTVVIDLITNKDCNMNCKYCFEQGHFKNTQLTEETINNIFNYIKLLKEKDPSVNFEFILIGGEPSIAKNLNLFLEKLKTLDEKDLKKITYMTNGLSKEKIENHLNQINNLIDPKKIELQISYDGKGFHDKNRLFKQQGNLIPTSAIIKENIDYFYNSGKCYVTIKSTITYQDLLDKGSLLDTLNDFEELNEKYHILYSVSEDKTSFEIPENLFKNNLNKLLESLLILERFEKDFFKKKGYFLTKWFNGASYRADNKTCGMGNKIISFSPTGDAMACHAIEYYDTNESKKDLLYGNINQDSLDSIYENFERIKKEINNNKYNQCIDCKTLYCSKCPAYTFESLKDLKKIYTGSKLNNQNLCNFFNLLSINIYRVYKELNILDKLKK